MTALIADRDQIARFTQALFKCADVGSFVSLRVFTHDRPDQPGKPIGLLRGKFPCEQIGAGSLDNVIDRATRGAAYAANHREPAVFCPPICTFSNDQHGGEDDLANGLALSVECDQRPVAARAELEQLLGPATIVMESGGIWIDPGSGKVENKIHLHWRLDRPTRDAHAHAQLKQARAYATAIAGGDASGTPMVHPMRWPGSWHMKNPAAPRLAVIAAETDREINLDDTFEVLVAQWGGDADSSPSIRARDNEHWRQLADGVDEGTVGRIGAIISVFGCLLRRGIEPHLSVALARAYNAQLCRPPVEAKKVERALISIMEREGGR